MTRRDFLKSTIAASFGLSLAGCAKKTKPNIVFIYIDDLGYGDLGCYGNSTVKTPNIDKLATNGRKFTNYYANSPICSPSRVAVTTGQYPQRWRIQSYLASRSKNRSRKMANYLDPKAWTVAKLMKNENYATAHFGKWHMGGGRDVGDAPLPAEYGYDESWVSFEGLGNRYIFPNGHLAEASIKLGRGDIVKGPKSQSTEFYVNKSIEFVRKNKNRPFYLRLCPNDVHDPHKPKEENLTKWKTVTNNPFKQKFYAVLEGMDKQIGRLIKEIEFLELAKNTLIIFTSDNGPTDWPSYYKKGWEPPGSTGSFFGRKWSLYEGGIRMPFIACWDGKIPPGTIDKKTIISGIDLLPTFCEIADVPILDKTNLDGKDMSKAILGTPIEREQPLFWEYGAFGSIKPGDEKYISPKLAIRDGKWKLLMNPDETNKELYNLNKDPGEKLNLYQNKTQKLEVLTDKLLSWWKEMKSYYI